MIPGTPTAQRRSAGAWRRLARLDAPAAAAWYAVLAVAMTWPVAASLSARLPGDLGDPLFNCWVLRWNFDHLVAAVSGHADVIAGYWNAGIFHPEPLALLYSDHLFAPAVEALPAWVLSHNVVLCYNLLFLSTFVLSGLGTFLLVRELTGSARAGFVAGLFYAFAPYRLSQLGHLQVLSSQWMPFALFGLRRFFASRGRWLPLAGAALALVAQNLSSGYYMVYFAPFVAAYVLWETGTRGWWREGRVWTALLASGAAVAAACLPFLLKYQELRQRGFGPRPLDEIRAFSADTFSYLRSVDELWLWRGGLTSFTRSNEGYLFPGVVPVALALLGIACLVAALRRRSLGAPPVGAWRLALAVPAALAGVTALGLAGFELVAGRWIWRIRNASPWLADVQHVFLVIAACCAVVVVLLPRARVLARLAFSSGRAFFAALFFVAVWMSFGPLVTTWEHGIAADTLYSWFYRHVPGFDGLRVPARYAMLATLFLAILGGYGAAALDAAAGAWNRRARWVLPAAAALFLLEASSMPLAVPRIEWARRDGQPGSVSAAGLDRVYAFIRKLPRDTVVAEFPFGGLEPEVRAVYLSTAHGHPIVNGYSGWFPPAYRQRAAVLGDPLGAGDRAWQAIVDSGATCLVVHLWAFAGGDGRTFCDWLLARGALPLATFQSERLFQVPR